MRVGSACVNSFRISEKVFQKIVFSSIFTISFPFFSYAEIKYNEVCGNIKKISLFLPHKWVLADINFVARIRVLKCKSKSIARLYGLLTYLSFFKSP